MNISYSFNWNQPQPAKNTIYIINSKHIYIYNLKIIYFQIIMFNKIYYSNILFVLFIIHMTNIEISNKQLTQKIVTTKIIRFIKRNCMLNSYLIRLDISTQVLRPEQRSTPAEVHRSPRTTDQCRIFRQLLLP